MTASTNHERPWVREIVLAFLLALLTAAAFARGLGGGFVYDDRLTVERNPSIASFRELPASLAKPMWDFTGPENTAAVGYWRPLANVALATGRALGGGSPFAFHALSLALHVLATLVAFRLASRIAQDTWIAFFAALLFGLHPVHVEAVSWLSSINEPLCGLFVLLAIDGFLAWRERGSSGVPWLAGIWFFLGLLSKELAVAVVPLALAIDGARRVARRDEASWVPCAVHAYAPFAVFLGAWYAARVGVFASAWAGLDRTTTEFGVGGIRLALLRVELLGNGIGLLVWPEPLRVFHPFVPGASWAVIGPALAVCAAWSAVVFVAVWKRSFALTIAALFAPAAIAPMLGRVGALGLFPLAERYLYVAALGIALCIAFVAMRTLSRMSAAVLLSCVALASGIVTFRRTAVWADEKTLLTIAALEAPRSPYAHRVLGKVLLEEFRRTNDLDTLRAAHDQFQAALDLGFAAQHGDDSIFAVSDDFLQSNVGLGWCLMREAELTGGDYSDVVQVFEMVLKRYPTSAEAWTGLGVAHTAAGDLDEAVKALEQALAIDSRFVEAINALGLVRMRRGEWTAAASAFEEALRHRPDHVDYLLMLAGAHERAGNDAGAKAAIERAAAIAPRDPRPRVLVGILAAKNGDLDGALRIFDRVLEDAPNSADAWLQKGKVLLAKGERNGAQRALIKATECDTRSFEAHYNTGALLLSMEGLPAAMPYLARAYELRGKDAAGKTLRDTLLKLEIHSVDALRALATVDADHKDADGALEWITRALALKSDDAQTLYLQGGMLRAKGDREGALRAWTKTCELMPESELAWESTGALLAEMGRRSEARECLIKAQAIAQKDAAKDPRAREAAAALQVQIDSLSGP